MEQYKKETNNADLFLTRASTMLGDLDLVIKKATTCDVNSEAISDGKEEVFIEESVPLLSPEGVKSSDRVSLIPSAPSFRRHRKPPESLRLPDRSKSTGRSNGPQQSKLTESLKASDRLKLTGDSKAALHKTLSATMDQVKPTDRDFEFPGRCKMAQTIKRYDSFRIIESPVSRETSTPSPQVPRSKPEPSTPESPAIDNSLERRTLVCKDIVRGETTISPARHQSEHGSPAPKSVGERSTVQRREKIEKEKRITQSVSQSRRPDFRPTRSYTAIGNLARSPSLASSEQVPLGAQQKSEKQEVTPRKNMKAVKESAFTGIRESKSLILDGTVASRRYGDLVTVSSPTIPTPKKSKADEQSPRIVDESPKKFNINEESPKVSEFYHQSQRKLMASEEIPRISKESSRAGDKTPSSSRVLQMESEPLLVSGSLKHFEVAPSAKSYVPVEFKAPHPPPVKLKLGEDAVDQGDPVYTNPSELDEVEQVGFEGLVIVKHFGVAVPVSVPKNPTVSKAPRPIAVTMKEQVPHVISIPQVSLDLDLAPDEPEEAPKPATTRGRHPRTRVKRAVSIKKTRKEENDEESKEYYLARGGLGMIQEIRASWKRKEMKMRKKCKKVLSAAKRGYGMDLDTSLCPWKIPVDAQGVPTHAAHELWMTVIGQREERKGPSSRVKVKKMMDARPMSCRASRS
jgi:hypothetical protein